MADDDSVRTLIRTTRLLRVVGGILLLIGLLLMAAVADNIGRSFRIAGLQRTIFIATASSIALGPGLLYWILSIFIKRRRIWAVLSAELVSWFQIFFAATLLLLSCLAPEEAWMLSLFAIAWIGMTLLILSRLRRCPRAIHTLNKQVSRGFELDWVE